MDEDEVKAWRRRAYSCGKGTGHDWMAISKVISENSEHVTMIMCGRCFHMINISEVHKGMEAIHS